LIFYAPGLLGYSTVKIASPTFYAMRDSRTPVAVSAVAVVVNVVLNLALVRVMGYRGLALGTALSSLFNAGVLLWLLRGRLDGLDGRRIALSLMKISAASIAMGFGAVLTHRALQDLWPQARFAGHALQLIGAIGVALVVLALAARLLRLVEFDEVFGQLRRRLLGRVRGV
jgi:putative peptidoglycan lipid II flippase